MKFEEEKAVNNFIMPFFAEFNWRLKLRKDVIKNVNRVRWLVRYLVKANKYQNFRLNYLKLHFQEQIALYYYELSKSKKKPEKKLCAELTSLKWAMVEKLCKLYLQRCRF
jgi:hypothetical protein